MILTDFSPILTWGSPAENKATIKLVAASRLRRINCRLRTWGSIWIVYVKIIDLTSIPRRIPFRPCWERRFGGRSGFSFFNAFLLSLRTIKTRRYRYTRWNKFSAGVMAMCDSVYSNFCFCPDEEHYKARRDILIYLCGYFELKEKATHSRLIKPWVIKPGRDLFWSLINPCVMN